MSRLKFLSPIVVALLLFGCGGGGGPDVVGTYPITVKQFANGGSFPCNTELADDDTRNAWAIVTDGDFGLDVETCNEDKSDCFPILFLNFSEHNDTRYWGTVVSASESGGLCSLNHTTSVLELLPSGGIQIDIIHRYQSGEPGNCTLDAAEAISDVNRCTGVEKIITGPPTP